jgi:hypothetical protein
MLVSGALSLTPSAAGGGVWYGDRGLFHHGLLNTISYINITTTGDSSDFGNRTISTLAITSVAGNGRAVSGGGESPYNNTLDYITISTTGNATDYGDLLEAREYSVDGFGSETRGIIAGGKSGATTKDVIQYITIATTGNATDFGNLNVAACCGVGAASSGVRGVVAGGYNYALAVRLDVVQYITIATTGNATDFGNLTVGRNGTSGCSSETRGVFCGGYSSSYSNVMDYVTIDTTGNATDFGDTVVASNAHKGTANDTTGVLGQATNLTHFTIATTGNATSFGNLSEALGSGAACSGD